MDQKTVRKLHNMIQYFQLFQLHNHSPHRLLLCHTDTWNATATVTFTLACDWYAGQIICGGKNTIGKALFLPAVSRRLKFLPHIPLFIHLFSSFGGSFITLHYLLSSAGESDSLIWNQAASVFGTRFWAQVNFKTRWAILSGTHCLCINNQRHVICDFWCPAVFAKENGGRGAERRSRGCVGVCFVFIFEICSPTILLGVPNTVAHQH